MTGGGVRWIWTLLRGAAYGLGALWVTSADAAMSSFLFALAAGAAFADSLTFIFRSMALLPRFKWQDLADIAVMTPLLVLMSGQVEELRSMQGSELGGGFLGFMGVFMAKVAFYSAEVLSPAEE